MRFEFSGGIYCVFYPLASVYARGNPIFFSVFHRSLSPLNTQHTDIGADQFNEDGYGCPFYKPRDGE